MHRVINLQSIGKDVTTISNHKTALQTMRDNYSTYIHNSAIDDGTNEDGNPTLAVSADFNDSTQGNTFHNELKQYIQNNANDFSFAKTRVHDCNHAAGINEPCVIGDTWSL